MEAPVLLAIDKRVAVITLNRPDKLNALNEEMMRLYVDALEQCRTSVDVDVIVVTGAGRGFCGGGDVSRLGDARQQTPIEVKEAFWDGLHRIPKSSPRSTSPSSRR